MESKNVIAAISLSTAVIVLYSLFFLPDKTTTKQNLIEKNKIEQSSDTPTLEQKETSIQFSREEALEENQRVKLEALSSTKISKSSFLPRIFTKLDLDYRDYVGIDEKYFRPEELDDLKGDCTKAKNMLGWVPNHSLDDGIKKTLKWYSENL